MTSRFRWITLIIVVLLALAGYLSWKGPSYLSAAQGEVVQLVFELDKKFEFGEYYFDLDNGARATFPLCFCLTERNMFPPDCSGDVKYIYNNNPGTMCVPLHIATGRCSSKVISSSSYATMFLIPLEYSWTKPVEKIIMGIRVPTSAPVNARLEVQVNIYKRNDFGRLEKYKDYRQSIHVRKTAN